MNEQEQNTGGAKNLSIDDAVAVLLSELPLPVQKFVVGEERARITLELKEKYNLHVDQAAVFERAFIFMLLGISTPDEFVRTLKDAGVAEAKVSGLTTDINERVFLRIRNEERANQASNSVQSTEVPQRTPITSNTSQSVGAQTPPEGRVAEVTVQKNVPTPPNLPGQTIPPPAPRPMPPPPPRIDVPTPPPAPPTPPHPQAPASDESTRIIHTMARDMQALKSGEDPFRVAHPAPPAWAITPSAPIAPSATMQAAPTPPPTPEPARETPPAHNEPLRAHLKQYGVDPYREPVE